MLQSTKEHLLPEQSIGLALLFIVVLSFFTYVYNFSNPQALFWDENYHIASAQKYLNGVFFMEPHPPLGKLFIALGEKILDRNELDDQFITTDYAQNPPAGFSFTGYRLFPVLFAWWTAPLIFCIFFLLTRRTLWSLLFSFLYIFDNALIVHQRSAMLESTLLFFSALLIVAFLLLFEWKDDRRRFAWAAILFGASFACVLTTKAFGLLFILLLPLLLLHFWKRRDLILRFLLFAVPAFLLLYAGIWHIHFSLGSTIQPTLPDGGYYQASPAYKAVLTAHKNRSPLAFPLMLRDSLNFVSHYQRGVPRLDLCKKDENGSPWFLWPVGSRSISYRWETPDGNAYRYLYLQSNPVGWFLGLSGVLLSLLWTFVILYVSYMAAVSQITRVMYLYHYFLPLLFSFFLFALAFEEIRRIGRWQLTEERKTALLLGLSLLVFVSFQVYRPLTYYEPLTEEQFERRNLLHIWDLHCVDCDNHNPLVVPAT